MPQIPERVQVGPLRYDVVITEEEIEEGRYGSVSHTVKQRIQLNPNNSPQQNLVTLVHEIMHAAAHVYAVKEDNEKDIKRLANGVTQALQSCGLLPDGLER